jgi:hypothetical protein
MVGKAKRPHLPRTLPDVSASISKALDNLRFCLISAMLNQEV